MRLVTVVGARPQFIKAAPIARALEGRDDIEPILVHTGQHFDDEMSEVFFRELGIPTPDFNLGIHSGPHGAMTGRMMEAIERVFEETEPDWVLVYGDTNSTAAAAIAAAKMPARLAHVEAGLRSFNRRMPEEVNRVLTDHVSDLCLAPTEAAMANLASEGIVDRAVHAGDVMFDAVRIFTSRAMESPRVIEGLDLDDEYILATVHRAENTDDPVRLEAIVTALAEIAGSTTVVLPLHPRAARAIESAGIDTGAIKLLSPVGYLDMLALEHCSRLVVTDSGGVQKEAFFQGRPCVTLRDETEWVELVDLGWNRLVSPTCRDAVVAAILGSMDAPSGAEAAPYGDGAAADLILDAIVDASS